MTYLLALALFLIAIWVIANEWADRQFRLGRTRIPQVNEGGDAE